MTHDVALEEDYRLAAGVEATAPRLDLVDGHDRRELDTQNLGGQHQVDLAQGEGIRFAAVQGLAGLGAGEAIDDQVILTLDHTHRGFGLVAVPAIDV